MRLAVAFVALRTGIAAAGAMPPKNPAACSRSSLFQCNARQCGHGAERRLRWLGQSDARTLDNSGSLQMPQSR